MKRLSILLLFILLIFGAGARLYRLDEKSLWSDEIATIATSLGNSIDPDAYALRHERFDPSAPVPAAVYRQKATTSHGVANFEQTVSVLKANVHPPLFFWLMNLWIHAFGLAPDQLRLPAVCFGILVIPLMYLLSLRLASLNGADWSNNQQHWFALLSTGMVALSAYQIDHAQDARQYTLLILLALIAAWLAIGLVQKNGAGWWRWLALVGVLGCGYYTQYFFMSFAGFIGIYLAWQGRNNRIFLGKGLLALALFALLVWPWLPIFKIQMTFFSTVGHYTSKLWKPVQLPEKLWRIVCDFLIPGQSLGKIAPLLILLLALGSHTFKNTFRPKANGFAKISPVLRFILLWLLVVIGGQLVLDILKQTHTATIRRYLLLASPACYLLLAYALVVLKQNFAGRAGKILTIALTLLLTGLTVHDTIRLLGWKHTSSDEFRQAAQVINHQAKPNDLVLVHKSGAMAVGMAYYLHPQIRMWGLHIPPYTDLAPHSALIRQLNYQLPDSGKTGPERLWLVFSHAAPSTQTRLNQWLMQKGYAQLQKEKYPGVQLALWQRHTK